MTRAESLPPASRRFTHAARVESERLSRQLGRLDTRIAALRAELESALGHRDEAQARLELLERIAGSSPRLQVVATLPADRKRQDTELRVLRGSAIREFAVRVMLSSGSTSPLHYQQWYELLRRRGLAAGGKDPLATFLTQLNRSPIVAKAGRSGEYRIDFDAPERLRGEVATLRRRLTSLSDGRARSADEVAAESKERAALMRTLARAERELEETLRVLGDVQNEPTSSVRRHP